MTENEIARGKAMKSRTKRILNGLSAILVAAALIGGTFAYTMFGHKSNKLKNNTKFQARLIENFEPVTDWSAGETITKEISVKNMGGADPDFPGQSWGNIYVRVQLKEYMNITTYKYTYLCDENDMPVRFMVDIEGSFVKFKVDPSLSIDEQATRIVSDENNWQKVVGNPKENEFIQRLTAGDFIKAQSIDDDQEYYYVKTNEEAPNGIYGKHLLLSVNQDVLERKSLGTVQERAKPYSGWDDGSNDECNYDVHIWEYGSSDCEMAFHEYISWDITNDFVYLDEWDQKATGRWILDTESGWAYWGQALAPGERTDNLLNSITLETQPEGEFYYVIHADMSAVSLDELFKIWADAPEKIRTAQAYGGSENITEPQVPEGYPKTFAELESNLIQVCEDKGFSGLAQELFVKALRAAYTKYNNTYMNIFSFTGMPGGLVFFTDNYVNPIRDVVKSVTVYTDWDEWRSYAPPNAAGLFSYDQELAFYYSLAYSEKYLYSIIVHEVLHAMQDTMMWNTDVLGRYHVIFSEGCSKVWGDTLFSKMGTKEGFYQFPVLVSPSGDWYPAFAFGTFSGDGSAYAAWANLFVKLLFITDYDTVTEYYRTANFDNFKAHIDTQYGAGTAEPLFDDILYISYNTSRESEMFNNDCYEPMIRIESTVLRCLKTKLNTLTNKKDLEKFLNMYRMYKYSIMFSLIDEWGEYSEEYSSDVLYRDDLTEKIPEIYNLVAEIDNILVEKIISAGVLPAFSKDAVLNRLAVKAVLHTSWNLDSGLKYYFAPDLYCAKYKFVQNGSGAQLFIHNSYDDEDKVLRQNWESVFTFNKDTTKIEDAKVNRPPKYPDDTGFLPFFGA